MDAVAFIKEKAEEYGKFLAFALRATYRPWFELNWYAEKRDLKFAFTYLVFAIFSFGILNVLLSGVSLDQASYFTALMIHQNLSVFLSFLSVYLAWRIFRIAVSGEWFFKIVVFASSLTLLFFTVVLTLRTGIARIIDANAVNEIISIQTDCDIDPLEAQVRIAEIVQNSPQTLYSELIMIAVLLLFSLYIGISIQVVTWRRYPVSIFKLVGIILVGGVFAWIAIGISTVVIVGISPRLCA